MRGGGVEFIVVEPEEAGFGEAVCLLRKVLAENWALARCDSSDLQNLRSGGNIGLDPLVMILCRPP